MHAAPAFLPLGYLLEHPLHIVRFLVHALRLVDMVGCLIQRAWLGSCAWLPQGRQHRGLACTEYSGGQWGFGWAARMCSYGYGYFE
jgi:hypothetical protein